MKHLIFLPLTILFCMTAQAQWQGKVLEITEGDTYKVKKESGKTIDVKLYGVDCPESGQKYGGEATQKVKGKIGGKSVKIDHVDSVKEDGIIAKVYFRKTMINEWVVKNGLAWVYNKNCDQDICDKWENIQQKKQANKIGLWSQSNPVPPWKYRDITQSVANEQVDTVETKSNNDTLKKDFSKLSENLKLASFHVDKYKSQINTSEGLKIGGAVVVGLTSIAADIGSDPWLIGFIGGMGFSVSGFITDLTAESHLDNASRNLENASEFDR